MSSGPEGRASYRVLYSRAKQVRGLRPADLLTPSVGLVIEIVINDHYTTTCYYMTNYADWCVKSVSKYDVKKTKENPLMDSDRIFVDS